MMKQLLLTLIMGLTFFTAVTVAAEEVLVAVKPADVRVLIDVSGSMKQNDPRNLRRPALDLLTQLIPDQSKSGVWTFGRYVNMLVKHAEVNDRWRKGAKPQSRLVNSVALHTNIGLALEKANYDSDIKAFPASASYRKSVILLTDGVVDIDADISNNEAERQRILTDILSAYQQAGIAIHTVALSTNADVELLEKLSLETDGLFAVAEDASDLNRIFLNALDRSAPADQVPLKDNRFLIDSSVEEFTALVFRKPGSNATQLQSPAGDIYSVNSAGASIRWFASNDYDLITIKQPVEGEWTINAELDPENRVTVVSNLTLDVKPLANTLYLGDDVTVSAQLSDSNQPVTDSNFLDIITVSASLLEGNQTLWEKDLPREVSTPGVYQFSTDELTQQGTYTLPVIVDGKTFKREKTQTFSVKPSFRATLNIQSEKGEYSITVVADNPTYRSFDVVVSATTQLPDGREVEVLLESTELGEWSMNSTDQSTGSYQVDLTASLQALEKTVDGSIAGSSIDIERFVFRLEVPGVPEPVIESKVEEPEPIVTPAEPEPDVIPEPEPVAETEEPAVKEEGSSRWMLYGALVVGNLFLIGLLFFFYRKLTASDAEDDVGDAAKEGEKVEEDVQVSNKTDKEELVDKKEPEEEEGENDDEGVDASIEAQKANDEVDKLVSNETEDLKEESPAVEVEAELEVETETESKDGDAEPDSDSELEVDLEALLDQEAEDLLAGNNSEPSGQEQSTGQNESIEEPLSHDELDDIIADLGGDDLLDGAVGSEEESPVEANDDEVSLELDDLEISSDEIAENAAVQKQSQAEEAADEDGEVSLDFDGEFDLSTDMSDEVKKQTGS